MINRYRVIFWIFLVLYGGYGIWWMQYGSWKNNGNTLLSHDIVRFGPIPVTLFGLWWILFILSFLKIRIKKEPVGSPD
jgi:hypothetical protein